MAVAILEAIATSATAIIPGVTVIVATDIAMADGVAVTSAAAHSHDSRAAALGTRFCIDFSKQR